MSRARRAGRFDDRVEAAPARADFGDVSSPRLITVVKNALAPSIRLAMTSATTTSSRKAGRRYCDLVAEGDPQMARDRVGRREALPIAHDRFLDPLQIDAVVDMTHVVDVGGEDPDGVVIGDAGHGRDAVFR